MRRAALADALSIAAFGAAVACLLARIDHVPPLAWWPLLAAAALAGLCAADAATGFTHWAFDTFFEETTPGIGRAFVLPFREHHRDPKDITRHGFLEVSGNNALALTPPAWLAAPVARDFGSELGASLALAFLLAGVVAAFASNQLHRWAHVERAPAAARWLQQRGWILSPGAHALHHRGPHDRAYCVTTGWMNPLLDGLGVFRTLERALGKARPLGDGRRASS